MLRDNPSQTGQEDMFRARLDALLDPRHELVRLAGVIDWSGLEEDLSPYYCLDDGRPGAPMLLDGRADIAEGDEGAVRRGAVCGMVRESLLSIFLRRRIFSACVSC